jgi:hypothetical protein
MSLHEDILKTKRDLEAVDAERAELNARLNQLHDRRQLLKDYESNLNLAMLSSVHQGLAAGLTFAEIGARLDAEE